MQNSGRRGKSFWTLILIIAALCAVVVLLVVLVLKQKSLLSDTEGRLRSVSELLEEMEEESERDRVRSGAVASVMEGLPDEQDEDSEKREEAEGEGLETVSSGEEEAPPMESEQEMDPAELGKQVTIIGDSISWLTEEEMKAALPGVDIYAWGGKTFDWDNGPDNPSGLNVIRDVAEQGKLRDIVVFALGTNNRDSVSMKPLDETMFEQLHNVTGDRRVYLVTNYDLRNPETYDRNNAAIRAAAEKYEDWHVIDWVQTVESTGDPERYIVDEGEAAVGNMQVHPTKPEGYQLWIDMICKALKQ